MGNSEQEETESAEVETILCSLGYLLFRRSLAGCARSIVCSAETPFFALFAPLRCITPLSMRAVFWFSSEVSFSTLGESVFPPHGFLPHRIYFRRLMSALVDSAV